MRQEVRAQKAAENRKRTETVRKQREDARLKKEAEQREREAKLQEEHRRRIAAEKKKVHKFEDGIARLRISVFAYGSSCGFGPCVAACGKKKVCVSTFVRWCLRKISPEKYLGNRQFFGPALDLARMGNE